MAAPYSTLEDCVSAARVRINDVIGSAAGQTFTDTAPFAILIINLAYQKMQQHLVSLGYRTLESEIVIPNVPPVASPDAALQPYLSWTGYNDGATTDPSYVLPQSLIKPIWMKERPTALAPPDITEFTDMDDMKDKALPSEPKKDWNQIWRWYADAIRIPGANVYTDLRIGFLSYLADFVAASTTAFASQPVPIMRAKDAFSAFIAFEFCSSRGDVDAASLMAMAKDGCQIIVTGGGS